MPSASRCGGHVVFAAGVFCPGKWTGCGGGLVRTRPLWHFLFCMLDLLLVLQIINVKANAMRWKNEILTAFLCISSK